MVKAYQPLEAEQHTTGGQARPGIGDAVGPALRPRGVSATPLECVRLVAAFFSGYAFLSQVRTRR